jgi:hypothetical protein
LAQKAEFRRQWIPADEQYMVHGTHLSAIEKILKEGFNIDAQPVSRAKGSVYGRGNIYNVPLYPSSHVLDSKSVEMKTLVA